MSEGDDTYREGYKAGYTNGYEDGKGAGYSDAKCRTYMAFDAARENGTDKQALKKVEDALIRLIGTRG